MDCPHASTTVMLHLFGEAPPSYAAHLAGCLRCQEALAEHADTLALVEPALLALPAPTSGSRSAWLGAGFALAAALALALLPGPASPPPPIDLSWNDPLTAELSGLEADIAAMSADPLADLEIP